MAKKLAEDVKLRRVIRRAIESRKFFLDKPERADYRQKISIFLEKFVLCEVGTKKALVKYYENKGNDKNVEAINMPIDDIRKALEFAGFDITEMSIEKMFKKNNARSSKSARDIRNAIAHDWSVNDIQELIDRWDEFQEILYNYIGIILREPLE